MQEIRMLEAGEQGLVVEFGNEIDPAVNAQVHRLARILTVEMSERILEVVPTYRSLMVYFDPLVISRKTLQEDIARYLADIKTVAVASDTTRIIAIPVSYGGEFGPDLEFVARRNAMTEDEVVAIHTSSPYLVYMLGFTPGFPYLGGMSERIATPRLDAPRVKIPAGSVGIAAKQTGIYPIESPGGWQLIGRTPLIVFNPSSENPFLYAAGDYLRFVAIRVDEYRALKEQVTSGNYAPVVRVSQERGLTVCKVIDPGMLSTIQDRGRTGHRAFGMPVSGVMDRDAFAMANILAGNGHDAAVVEMTMCGGRFRFPNEAYVAVCGADMQGILNGERIQNWSGFYVPANSELAFGYVVTGCRAYLAFSGGIDAPQIMGSRSTYLRARLGGYEGRALQAGDVLEIARVEPLPLAFNELARSSVPIYASDLHLRVILGPQNDLFTDDGILTFLRSGYTVSARNDRMAYLLEGAAITHKNGPDIVSDALCPGAVQVPGNGLPIVMMADCATTGGYAKIGTVIGPDLAKLAQAKAGDRVSFVVCSDAEAIAALIAEKKRYEKALQTRQSPTSGG
jgi:antagonist of KipI